MKYSASSQADIWGVGSVGLAYLLSTVSPFSALQAILGVAFVLFCPGYMLLAVLYPVPGQLQAAERLILSCVLSIAITILIGFFLTFSPWGIRTTAIVVALVLWVLATGAFAFWRRGGQGMTQGRDFLSANSKQSLTIALAGGNRLSLLMLVGFAAILAVISYRVVAPPSNSPTTEFFMLGERNDFARLPLSLKQGEPAAVSIGIINDEQTETTYRIEVLMGDTIVGELNAIVLSPGERTEQNISFRPMDQGSYMTSLVLYQEGNSEPYRILHFPVNIV
jgi:uncharacterized membrane protein